MKCVCFLLVSSSFSTPELTHEIEIKLEIHAITMWPDESHHAWRWIKWQHVQLVDIYIVVMNWIYLWLRGSMISQFSAWFNRWRWSFARWSSRFVLLANFLHSFHVVRSFLPIPLKSSQSIELNKYYLPPENHAPHQLAWNSSELTDLLQWPHCQTTM